MENNDKRIDELINRIDSFMSNGGGRMNVSGGDGEEVKEQHTSCCCGEFTDSPCCTPVKKTEE